MADKVVQTRNPFKDWTIWIALFIFPLLFYPKALSSAWVSNSDVHSLLEFWAAAIALTTAGIVLIHFFATGRRLFLLISLGFTLQGTEDLVHAIYSFSRIWPVERVGIVNFVPGTYVAGRLILITCIFLALFLGKSIIEARNRTKQAMLYDSIGFVLAAVATAIVINSPLPRFILPGQIISRPVDFIAAILYLIAFFLFVRLYRNKEYHTPFMWSMIASIIFGFVTQVYMVHSQQLYDAQFDMSHVIKIFSYIFPIFGIAVGTFTMYKKEGKLSKELTDSIEGEKKKAEELASLNEKLRQTTEELEIAKTGLEKQVKEKTKEIERMSQEEWGETFNAITDLVFIQDKDFTITKVNKAF